MPDSSREIQRYLNQPLDDLMQEFDLYAQQAGGTMREPGSAWEKIVPALKHKVCAEDEWNWCERRQDARFDEPVNIIALLAGIVAPSAGQWGVPAALIAVILFKRGIDQFCGCAPLGAKRED
jgi:hypothetical protein